MARKSKVPQIIEQVEIVDIASAGKCIGKKLGQAFLVSGVVPGDVVDIQLNKRSRKLKEGKAIFFHQKSADRVGATCKYFGVCGGCKWQNLDYQKQLFYKENQVFAALTRIGKLKIEEKTPILPSPDTYFYRNKLDFTFANAKWLTKEDMDNEVNISNMNGLGFHVPGKFDRIVDIDQCHLQPDPSNDIRNFVREYTLSTDWPFYDYRKHEGWLRNMIVRNNNKGQWMVIFVFATDDTEKRELLMNAVKQQFSQIVSLLYVINPKKNDTIHDLEVTVFSGENHLIEEMEGLKFKVGPKSFYQTNPKQAYNLYKLARQYADLQGHEVVYDLYTGTGTIALFVAAKAQKVIGLEYVADAIEDAKANARLNAITNTDFFAGDIKDLLTPLFIEKHGAPHVVITDPPRAGMHPDVVKALMAVAPQKIVYISCNPATQARDVELLSSDYKMLQYTPVDMFPHTSHVENVMLLVRK